MELNLPTEIFFVVVTFAPARPERDGNVSRALKAGLSVDPILHANQRRLNPGLSEELITR